MYEAVVRIVVSGVDPDSFVIKAVLLLSLSLIVNRLESVGVAEFLGGTIEVKRVIASGIVAQSLYAFVYEAVGAVGVSGIDPHSSIFVRKAGLLLLLILLSIEVIRVRDVDVSKVQDVIEILSALAQSLVSLCVGKKCSNQIDLPKHRVFTFNL